MKTTRAIIFSALLAFQQFSAAEAGALITPAVTLPRLPTGAVFARLRWDLGSIDPILGGAIFEIEAQEASAAAGGRSGTYRFRMPRLASARSPIRVRGIKVLVNDRWDPAGSAFANIDRTVAAGDLPADPAELLPFPVLSPKAIVVAQELGEGDQLRIELAELTLAADAPACIALEQFRANVEPAMRAKNCYSCHSSDQDPGMGNARLRFPMSGDTAAVCARALQRTDSLRPEESALVEYPLRRANGHTRIFVRPEEILPAWTSWIEAERRRGALRQTRIFQTRPSGGSTQ